MSTTQLPDSATPGGPTQTGPTPTEDSRGSVHTQSGDLPAPRRRWVTIGGNGSDHASHHASQNFSAIAGYLFGSLRLNLVLLIGALPLFLLCVLAADPLAAPPALLAAVYLALPIIAVAFCAFRDCPAFHMGRRDGRSTQGTGPGQGTDSWWAGFGEQSILRPTLAILRETAPRVLRLTAVPTGLALVLVVDAQWAAGQPFGAFLVPALLLGALVCVLSAFTLVALITERADAPWHVLVRVAAHAVIRSWPLSILNVVVLAIALAGLIWQPILSWILASSLALYVVWADARWAVLPALRK